ncbi:hypothetical protein EMIHUDRAFT_224381 [Emiliania huxleyi CCMP1516]|uniref:Uncharacterized protein n=2 Tax=Emiliania huxleyi TaxID=2903 RepID=A0A0D3KS63_EMIH1|nr:hypothetical protein EMIHUDRAFT_224381 [Emiliania huxleyi CCMP1516]EOD38598.1 hypothetical protein EMIHUDRAFT_224381 [Emiliania huxleyi CCMP1516]|eukprot:XP_005791027.1 hypothetical protein EMIHUDRAFT_224381 [Emiliania huxleyi CCMP1516]
MWHSFAIALLATVGQSCVYSSDCNSNEDCVSGTCKLERGEWCSTDSACYAGNCRGNRCCKLGISGLCTECNTYGYCGVCSGAYYPDGNYELDCTAKELPGTYCGSNPSDCVSGICLLNDGERCSSNWECQNGICRGNRCCNFFISGLCTECNTYGYCEECSGGYYVGSSTYALDCTAKELPGTYCGSNPSVCLSDICNCDSSGAPDAYSTSYCLTGALVVVALLIALLLATAEGLAECVGKDTALGRALTTFKEGTYYWVPLFLKQGGKVAPADP